ncbi:MAG: YraN family protein [Alphaproteobacteria bacterium]|nr:YraN family protein [Alphaproteobacteria bacterium]
MMFHKETSYSKGVQAEKLAKAYLERNGYKVIQVRYKTKYGEIDLVARKNNILCFIEVKARAQKSDALEAVTARSRKRIENAASLFLAENPDCNHCDMRFDVVTVTGDSSVQHLDNAWEVTS